MGPDRGLQPGQVGGIGRRLAHILGREGKPVERDRADDRLGRGCDMVHAGFPRCGQLDGWNGRGGNGPLWPSRACPDPARLRLPAACRPGRETAIGTDGVRPVRIGRGAIAVTGLAWAAADRRRAGPAQGPGSPSGWKSATGCTGTPVDTGGAIASEPACRRCVVQVRRRGDPVGGAGLELRKRTQPGTALSVLPGSSPRGRGTPRGGSYPVRRSRFIPAWAGNAGSPRLSRWPPPVHPRVGGERRICALLRTSPAGSSPRGRGTPSLIWSQYRHCRFIPAWAGNACRDRRRPGVQPVHPRVGGERQAIRADTGPIIGSSPRGRGTHLPHAAGRLGLRFIPAWAGERDVPVCRMDGQRRFIPAWAGNATAAAPAVSRPAVHPRVGGERLDRIWPT